MLLRNQFRHTKKEIRAFLGYHFKYKSKNNIKHSPFKSFFMAADVPTCPSV